MSVGTKTIPLARPVLGAREEELVVEVLRSGRLSLGPMLPRFERAFAERIGVPHASALASGTAGLHLALRAVGVTAGDEVVTTPFSFVASANAALYEGARPVFADIDPVTLNLDPDAARAAVTERTAAVLPVHIFGAPADVPAFETFGLPIVEDACEALGAVHEDGTIVGSRGHPAIYGFYANKQMTTGEGGVVTTGDPAVKARMDSERNQGRAPDMGWLDHDRLGFNYRLSDIACAIGLVQLERLDGMLADRARVAGWYAQALAGIEGLAGVLDDRQAEPLEGRRVGDLPEDVDRHHRAGATGHRGLRRRGVEVERHRVDVREHGAGALVEHRVGRGDERERRRDDLAVLLDADGAQRQVQPRGAGRDGAGVRRAHARGERLLEGGHARPEREVPGAQDLGDRGLLLGAEDRPRERDHEAAGATTPRRACDARPGSIPASSESTSASQDASMTFSWTPMAPHVSVPSEASSSTRVTAPVALNSSRMRTL